ncbi:MAG TPA: glycosyltransferase family 4 protein [Candidatus Limnocylindria bacterium]|nr:glycosyltransferase family 4 protein [Candidatus Limnocylindria bacterium]
MGLLFFPRGGSAHAAQNLAAALPVAGWDVTILTGSLTVPGCPGDARRFYAGLDVRTVDFTAALDAPDPLLADPPLHPSYEDRPGAPDRIMSSLDDRVYEHQVAAWAEALAEAGAAQADVLHLHHLTPLNEAAERVAPGVPVVAHLHGTELLMLEQIEARGHHNGPHAWAWAERLERWAARAERIIVLAETQIERAARLLDIDPERCVRIPNGFDPALFARRPVARRAHWRRHLVEAPRGWLPDGEPGSIAYAAEDLAVFGPDEDPNPVLLYVGRFTEVKRVALLIEAYARARPGFVRPAPLVLLGGFPGEWEGEHPAETIARVGAKDVFLAGWHGHDELPAFLSAADVVVLPSVREQFGQVLVEGMACGLPSIAVDAHGASEIVEHGETGWLVEPDDAGALANALVEAVNRPGERRRRGEAAQAEARSRYAWPALARDVAAVYDAARGVAGHRHDMLQA